MTVQCTDLATARSWNDPVHGSGFLVHQSSSSGVDERHTVALMSDRPAAASATCCAAA